MVNSNQKGKAGEREWAAYLRDQFGLSARRGQQYRGDVEAPDVVGGWPGTHCEVKRVEKLNVARAIEKAVDEAGPGKVAYVAHRRNREEWLITVRARDLVEFCECVI